MLFRVPVYISQNKSGYAARPLFHPAPHRTDDNLNRLLTKLSRDIVQNIERLGKLSRHEEAAAWAFSPRIAAHRASLTLELRRRTVRAKYFVAAFHHFGRRVAFVPEVPDVWFEVARNERIDARAEAALSEHFRKLERDADDESEVKPEAFTLAGKAWVQVLELSANIPAVVRPEPKLDFLALFSDAKPDGANELRRVGRCLDWLYPDELDRAVLRDREAAELERLLAASDRRPVLLCGPRLCGKTTLVHECVHRRVSNRKQVHVQKRNVWLVSPQRLISGMSYVGQWEGRLLAILKHAKKRDHVLYFDDLVGLFLAGITSQSSLSAAVVLKPYLERRDVRVLGEITPEGLRVLQERDRGFADLFHIIPVREPSDADTLRILIEQQRRLEAKHDCILGLDVLPAVIDLQRRYERTAAFPGKAAAILTRLALRSTVDEARAAATDETGSKPLITRDDVLTDFAARSGLSLAFLDPKQRLDRDEILEQLQKHVIGQPDAVAALADVVSVAKARLNDPDRPLASFLFLGPTGVGKTECAKAIARTLFGDADRLLRFDLNEFNQTGAAARLVGTFAQPEGLLTAAIRRQPFAVILLDEVEKAHPEVFDLLLQVLGEGRLTDSLGRTADFTHAIVLLTSNLGVREAEGSLGFTPESDRSFAYTRAAERFFRPEFFNRLDRVLPFRKLAREDLAHIARRLVNDVLNREGFSQRRCVLNVAADALERVIEAGYDPALGARAMKRAVERELTQPAATRLAALNPEELTIVTVRAEHHRLAVSVQSPGWAEKVIQPNESLPAAERLSDIRVSLDLIAESIAESRPKHPLTGGAITAEQERYFALKELVDSLSEDVDAAEAKFESRKRSYLEAAQPEAVGRRSRYRAVKVKNKAFDEEGGQPFSSLLSAFSMEEAIRELLEQVEPVLGEQSLFDLENRLALLNLMSAAPVDDRPVYLHIRGFPEGSVCYPMRALAQMYLDAWPRHLGVELRVHKANQDSDRVGVLQLNGLHARPLAESEIGTHLFVPKHGGPVPVRVDVLDTWPPVIPDPFAFGPILRVYPEGQPICDVRTGLVSVFSPEAFRGFTLRALPRTDDKMKATPE
jgi:ATP-dependent Clp protease ATP-binding subunit ClpA